MTIDFDHRKEDMSYLPPRERILLAAYETILEDQISGTRLRKIAKKAGMAQGHLHYYFASKDELLLELARQIIQSFSEDRERLLEDTGKSAMEKILALLEYKADGIKDSDNDYVLFDFWIQSISNEEIRKDINYRHWRETIRSIVQSGVKSGEFNPKNAELIPSYVISLMEGAALQYLIDNDAFNLEEYFQKAGEIIADLLNP